MKILEAQSATLTNYEVYTHLQSQKARQDKHDKKRRGPGNLETVVKELLDYLSAVPSPLSSQPRGYDETTLRRLLERVRPFNLTKAEVLMIANLRPASVPVLSSVVEEMELRFPDENTQQSIVEAILDVLGHPPHAAQAEGDGEEGDGEEMEQ